MKHLNAVLRVVAQQGAELQRLGQNLRLRPGRSGDRLVERRAGARIVPAGEHLQPADRQLGEDQLGILFQTGVEVFQGHRPDRLPAVRQVADLDLIPHKDIGQRQAALQLGGELQLAAVVERIFVEPLLFGLDAVGDRLGEVEDRLGRELCLGGEVQQILGAVLPGVGGDLIDHLRGDVGGVIGVDFVVFLIHRGGIVQRDRRGGFHLFLRLVGAGPKRPCADGAQRHTSGGEEEEQNPPRGESVSRASPFHSDHPSFSLICLFSLICSASMAAILSLRR